MRTSTRLVVLGRKFDTDAQAYITAVETADGAALEEGVKTAINNFVVGCKADGIWSAIKASCILAGARTLTGALVPLAGAAPTNFNFVSGDYNRKTGLKGNGVNKYLNTNRTENADPQNNVHTTMYLSEIPGLFSQFPFHGSDNDSATGFYCSVGVLISYKSRNQAYAGLQNPILAGFYGVSRSSSTTVSSGCRGSYTSTTLSSITSNATSYYVYRPSPASQSSSDARLAFYSIGESLDLALLDARVTTLINTYSTAIV